MQLIFFIFQTLIQRLKYFHVSVVLTNTEFHWTESDMEDMTMMFYLLILTMTLYMDAAVNIYGWSNSGDGCMTRPFC